MESGRVEGYVWQDFCFLLKSVMKKLTYTNFSKNSSGQTKDFHKTFKCIQK